MADVTLSYKGSDILELSDSGSATLKTGGTYCEADIEVEYVKPSGGSSEKVLTKLGEYTVTEPVASISITATEQMKSCDVLYIKINNLKSSAQDWLYPRVNFANASYGYFGNKADTWSYTLLFVNGANLSNQIFDDKFVGFLSTRMTGTPIRADSLSSFVFNFYTAGVTFNSGTIEIWGYV
jgi:hypothetical protein